MLRYILALYYFVPPSVRLISLMHTLCFQVFGLQWTEQRDNPVGLRTVENAL